MSDAYPAYTVLLLHCNGADNSTTFFDASVYHKTVTAYGNAAVKTAQSRFGGASLGLDGSGDYLLSASASQFNLGANDFTIEFFVYFINGGHGNDWARILQIKNNSSDGGLYIVSNASDNPARLLVQGYRSGSYFNLISPAGAISNLAWHHVFLKKLGGAYSLFVDDALYGYSTPSPAYTHQEGAVCIGSNTAGGESFYGYLDEIRITNGVARPDSTPPSAAFDDPAAPTGKVLYPRIGGDPSFGGQHRIASTVDRLGVTGPYPVRLYHRASGRLIRATQSDAAGNYAFDAIAYESGGYFAVAHDTNGDPLNAAIADLLTPVPM